MKTTKRDISAFIRGVEGFFSSEFSTDGRIILANSLLKYSIPVLTLVFRRLETGTVQFLPNPKEVIVMCNIACEETTMKSRTDHAYNLGRKFRADNIPTNPYKWIERRGQSCASLLLYFQKGWSDQDTDLTLSVS